MWLTLIRAKERWCTCCHSMGTPKISLSKYARGKKRERNGWLRYYRRLNLVSTSAILTGKAPLTIIVVIENDSLDPAHLVYVYFRRCTLNLQRRRAAIVNCGILTWHDALLHKLLPSPPLLQTELEDCERAHKTQVRVKPLRTSSAESPTNHPWL